MPPSAELLLLPFAQATSAQRTEALLTARQALAAAFPPYPYAQWQRAQRELALPVHVGEAGEPARLAPQSLVQLLAYLVAPPDGAAPPLPAAPEPPPLPALPALLPDAPLRKQTYALPPDLIERLARISHWQRRPLNHLAILALTRLVSQYPEEADRPIPPQPPLT